MRATRWKLAHGAELEIGARSLVMGILNVTPDSFSDGGRYVDVDAAVEQARRMLDEGADIIDVGGESTRPDALPVEAEEERARVLPVIEALVRLGAVISVDTYRAQTARLAVAAGAHIVNDVWGLQKDRGMADAARELSAGLVMMHTGRERDKLPDVIADQRLFLERSLRLAAEAGLEEDRLVLDPGFGFAKDTHENLLLMARFAELHALGRPLLAGTSRKRFVGAVTGREADDRDAATAATSAMLRMAGAAIFRVHNVTMNKDALAMADAVVAARREETEN